MARLPTSSSIYLTVGHNQKAVKETQRKEYIYIYEIILLGKREVLLGLIIKLFNAIICSKCFLRCEALARGDMFVAWKWKTMCDCLRE